MSRATRQIKPVQVKNMVAAQYNLGPESQRCGFTCVMKHHERLMAVRMVITKQVSGVCDEARAEVGGDRE